MGKCEGWVLWGLSLWILHGDVRRTGEREGKEELVSQILFFRKLHLGFHWVKCELGRRDAKHPTSLLTYLHKSQKWVQTPCLNNYWISSQVNKFPHTVGGVYHETISVLLLVHIMSHLIHFWYKWKNTLWLTLWSCNHTDISYIFLYKLPVVSDNREM